MELSLEYGQAAAGAQVDRLGLGEGIGLNLEFVDPEGGGTLHTAGGSFPLVPGDTTGTGLKRYLLKDLAVREQRGTLPEHDGLEEARRDYRWVLTHSDGGRKFFSEEGDLIAEEDAFGNRTAYRWELHGDQHRLREAVDTFGQAVSFGYGTEGRVTVTSPVRSDGRQPVTVLHLEGGRLTAMTYPEDQVVKLAWDYAPDGAPGRLLTRIESAAGAVTRIGYSRPHGFPVASSLKVTDQAANSLVPELTFRLGTAGEHEGHDYTGNGQYGSADDLFDSADTDYRYATELSDGRSVVRSVFNSLHLLKERTAAVRVNGQRAPVRTQTLEYEGERDGGKTPPPASALPANYGKPVRASVTVHDPATGRSRTTVETARFDEYGREVERTGVTGAETVTEYDPTALAPHTRSDGPGDRPAGRGLPLRVTVTGRDGAQTVTENTLSDDRRSIVSTRQLVKNKGEGGLSARTVTAFAVNTHGETSQRILTWASDNAKPGGVEGPDRVTERYEQETDTGSRQRTDRVTGPAGVTTQVTDLVTGQLIRATDAAGSTVENSYDEAGRIIYQKAPGGQAGQGLLTATSYAPGTKTVTSPGQNGRQHITVEKYDLLGRMVQRTDNVRGGELTRDPAARTLQSVSFRDEGRTAEVTDQAGRTTVTTSDDLGRPVKTVAPNGLTQLSVYRDAATADTLTVTTLTLPAGESDPARAVMTAVETLDSAERPAATAASYADGTQQTAASQAYDSLGRVAQTISREVALTPRYGTGGTAQSATLTPQNPAAFPGENITAAAPADLTGAAVTKTLTPGQDTAGARAGMTLLRDDAGRTAQERRPDGRKALYTYTPSGQVRESVSPSGIRTASRYDSPTGHLLETTVTSADGKTAQKTAYTYDPYTGAVTSIYDPGKADTSRIGYLYDADGNTTRVTYPDGKSVRQQYNDSGQLEKTADTAGLTTFYAYNPDGTLARAVQHERDDPASLIRASVTYTYDGLGRIVRAGRGNGVTTDVLYTGASQIRSEKTTRGSQLTTQAAYTYDSHGNLTRRTDTRPQTASGGTPGPAVTTSTEYRYDAHNRLISSKVLTADDKEQTASHYSLNVADDVVQTETSSSDSPGRPAVTSHSIDTSGRLTALTTDGQKHPQTFDTDGNLLTDHTGTRWTYNLHGQPATMTTAGGTAVRYTYWADGTRATTAETTPAGGSSGPRERTTVFHYAPGGTLINDTHTSTPADSGSADPADGREGTTASYLMAGARHARTLTGPGADAAASTGAGYIIADRHGSITALTGPEGNVTQAWNYTDYGQPASAAGTALQPPSTGPAGPARQPFTYAGEYTAADGTQYLKTRTYDPVQKRFTTADSAPQFNRYQAFNANPLTYTDPTGRTSENDWHSWLITGLSVFVTAISAVATAVSFGIAAPVTLMGLMLGGASIALDLASAAAESMHMPQTVIAGLKNAALGTAVADLPASAVSGILTGARIAGKMSMSGAMKSLLRIENLALPKFMSMGDMTRIARMHKQVAGAPAGNVCAVTALACAKNLREPAGARILVPATDSMRWVSHPRMKQLAGASSDWSAPMDPTQLSKFFNSKYGPAESYKMHIVSVRNSRIPQAAYALAGDIPTHYIPVVTSRNYEANGNWSSYALDLGQFYRITKSHLEDFDATEFRVLDVGPVHGSWFDGLEPRIQGRP
ncbi:RHS repeat-associated core domain-containing protein [Streptomyces sp. NPDC008121]|uniref:RHS repeat domain-containing protein n=1 Tax=Streptomyces sp. NPDC008121 TaxID=3364809 RepID=UPI0036EA5BF9